VATIAYLSESGLWRSRMTYGIWLLSPSRILVLVWVPRSAWCVGGVSRGNLGSCRFRLAGIAKLYTRSIIQCWRGRKAEVGLCRWACLRLMDIVMKVSCYGALVSRERMSRTCAREKHDIVLARLCQEDARGPNTSIWW